MKLQVTQQKASKVKADVLAIFVHEDKELFATQKSAILEFAPSAEATFDSGDFTGKKGSSALVYASAKQRVLLVGLGERAKIDTEQLRRAGAAVAKRAASVKQKNVAIQLPSFDNISVSDVAQALTEGVTLSLYKFDTYFSDADKKRFNLDSLTLFTDDKKAVEAATNGAERALIIAEGVMITRDLANAPNNEIYPESLAKRAGEVGKKAGFKTTVFDKKKVQSLKMAGLLAVNVGSDRPPVFIVMEYNGGKKGEQPIVLVGKGVTFDTGGISIKPGAGMAEMRGDMHGAASVIGTMHAIASLKLPLNVVGLVPSTDNMPSGTAYVPGDVITYSNGKTVEVDNTDAEGRLILADALIYASKFKPQVTIDLATLTGACVIALGHHSTGMMGTCDKTMQKLKESAKETHEYVCELPLYEEYEEQIKSSYADLKNSGGRPAGSITAGCFLKHFVADYPWVHLDIAGTSNAPSDSHYTPKGHTGVGVRLLTDLLSKWS